MRKSFSLALFITVASLLVIAACAPKAPPPPPAPPPAATPAAAPPRAAPPPTAPGDAAWAKAIEAAKAEGKVVLYGTGFTGEYGKRVVKAFQDKYGIPVEFVGGRLSELGEKVRTEQRVGQPVADGLQGGIQTLLGLKDVGALQKLDDLPVLREKDVWETSPHLEPEGYLKRYMLLLLVPFYNTTLVKPGEVPRSYKDLLDPKWKGKLLLDDPTTGGPGNIWFTMHLKYGILDEAYYEKLGAQVKIGRSPVEEAQSLTRGEFAILLPTDAQYFESILAEGGPVKPFVFEEAHHFAQRAVVMAKNPAHPNAARVFANWMLSKEGQTVIMTTGNWYSIRKDVAPQLSPDIKALQLKGKRIIHTLEDELYTGKLLREGAAARFFKK